MKKVYGVSLALTLIAAFATLVSAQQDAKKTSTPAKSSAGSPKSAATESARPLILSGSVPMEGVKGRFDHFASGQGQVFVSALGNNTVEVISIDDPADLTKALSPEAIAGVDAFVFVPDVVLGAHAAEIIKLVGLSNKPAIFPSPDWVDNGGFMSFGPDIADATSHLIAQLDRVLPPLRHCAEHAGAFSHHLRADPIAWQQRNCQRVHTRLVCLDS